MQYDFDQVVDRSKNLSAKYDERVKKLLVSGVHDPVLSGATNRFLSENRKPIDRIS